MISIGKKPLNNKIVGVNIAISRKKSQVSTYALLSETRPV